MDIEAVVARRLAAYTGVPAFPDVPAKDDAPDEFLTVEQTGGGGTYMDAVRLDVDCWALPNQRKRAQAIAGQVRAAVPDLDEEPNVFHPEAEGCYRMNDPDTGRARYVVGVSLWVCE